MIKKGNGRQPDNICYLILIDFSKIMNCNCYCYLIRYCRLKKLHLFVSIAAEMVPVKAVADRRGNNIAITIAQCQRT